MPRHVVHWWSCTSEPNAEKYVPAGHVNLQATQSVTTEFTSLAAPVGLQKPDLHLHEVMPAKPEVDAEFVGQAVQVPV